MHRPLGYLRRIIPSLLSAAGMTFLSSTALAQYVPQGISLDTPVDPRSVAMGESFVAAHSTESMMYNPAGLAGLQGASFSFSQRNDNYVSVLDDFRYIALQGTLETPFANLGLFYNRFSQGEMVVTTSAAPDGVGKVHFANYVLGATVAANLTSGLDGGLTVKILRSVEEVTSGSPPTVGSNTPILLDLGLIYSVKSEMGNFGDCTLSAGASLQNFGTDFKPLASSSIEQYSSEYIQKLPRYFRFGLALAMNIHPATPGGLTPLSFQLTTEYRNFLNGPDPDSRGFGGVGAEITLFELVAARAGGFVEPLRDVYGMEGKLAFRYGVGVSLPLDRLGVDVPLHFTGDVAAIPLDTDDIIFFPVEHTTLVVFSIGVQYTNPIF